MSGIFDTTSLSGVLENAVAYHLTNAAWIGAVMFGFICAVHVYARFDPKFNHELFPFFRVSKAYTVEESEGQPLPFLWRHRNTIGQVLSWLSYSLFAGFIIVEGFYINVKVGRDCPFAVNEYLSNNFTCAQAFSQFSITEGYTDGGAKEMTPACDGTANGGVPLEGYYCFRVVSSSELSFNRATETLGIAAALLPPYIFAITVIGKLIHFVAKRMTFCMDEGRTKNMAIKGIIIVQTLVFGILLILLLLFLLSEYLISYEGFIFTISLYLISSIKALLLQLDAEAGEDMGKEELLNSDNL